MLYAGQDTPDHGGPSTLEAMGIIVLIILVSLAIAKWAVSADIIPGPDPTTLPPKVIYVVPCPEGQCPQVTPAWVLPDGAQPIGEYHEP